LRLSSLSHGLHPEIRDVDVESRYPRPARLHGDRRHRGQVAEDQPGSRVAYVSVSRAQFDVQMYTNDAKALGYELSRDVSHPTAIQQEPAAAQKIEPQSVSIEASQGLSAG